MAEIMVEDGSACPIVIGNAPGVDGTRLAGCIRCRCPRDIRFLRREKFSKSQTAQMT